LYNIICDNSVYFSISFSPYYTGMSKINYVGSLVKEENSSSLPLNDDFDRLNLNDNNEIQVQWKFSSSSVNSIPHIRSNHLIGNEQWRLLRKNEIRLQLEIDSITRTIKMDRSPHTGVDRLIGSKWWWREKQIKLELELDSVRQKLKKYIYNSSVKEEKPLPDSKVIYGQRTFLPWKKCPS